MSPRIFKFKPTISAPVMEWIQSIADQATAFKAEHSVETTHDMICATKGAVNPHTDVHFGATEGMTIVGLVIRSDGHVLHTGRHPEGMPLTAGDLYMIDPADLHWTTVAGDDPEAQLIFSPHIMHLDERTPKKLRHDISFELMVQMIEATRGIKPRAA